MPRQEQGVEYYFIQNGEKRYRVRWRENGRMKSRSFLRVSGEDGARAFYARVRESQEAKGRLARVSAVSLTLAQFVAEVWGPKTKRRLSGKTWKRDAAVYNKHILEQLGEKPIAEIDAEALVVWQEELERGGLGSDSIIKGMSILSRIFKEAARAAARNRCPGKSSCSARAAQAETSTSAACLGPCRSRAGSLRVAPQLAAH